MNKEKIILFILITLMSMAWQISYAYSFSAQNSDGITLYYNLISNSEVEVTYGPTTYGLYPGIVNIPSTVIYEGEELTITSIGNSAFYCCLDLTSVIIPSSVTNIGAGAFMYCSKLTSVIIPMSVTSIGDNAFYDCSALTSVTIPSAVTSIGNNAFIGCSSLTNVSVANGNTVYDSRNDCNAIIETATNTLVLGCSTTTIPESVRSIGPVAFYNCTGLMNVVIPSSVVSIDDCAFYGCSGLTNMLIPSNVTSLGIGAFFGCTGLNSLTISEGVTIINEKAFSICPSLTSVTIPESVTVIGDFAFESCSNLTNVTIPSGLTYLGGFSFSHCPKLTNVYCYMETPLIISKANTFSNRANATLYVPYGTKTAYEAAYGWNDFKEIIEMNHTDISLTPSISPEGEGSGYFTLDGRKLYGKPTQKGVYIVNGKKIVIK